MGRKGYDEEFRKKALEMVLNGDKSKGEIAREVGISHASLSNWMKLASVPERNQEKPVAADKIFVRPPLHLSNEELALLGEQWLVERQLYWKDDRNRPRDMEREAGIRIPKEFVCDSYFTLAWLLGTNRTSVAGGSGNSLAIASWLAFTRRATKMRVNACWQRDFLGMLWLYEHFGTLPTCTVAKFLDILAHCEIDLAPSSMDRMWRISDVMSWHKRLNAAQAESLLIAKDHNLPLLTRECVPRGEMTDLVNSAKSHVPAVRLTAEEFQVLAEMPPEVEWFANIHCANTRRAYENDVFEFIRFVGIAKPEDFRVVRRAHIIAWRGDLNDRQLAPSTVRRKLSAIGALFNHLCESNAVDFNPVDGVKRPNAGANEGKSPALSDFQVRALLELPPGDTLKGLRDRAILSVLLFHALRRDEVAALKVGSLAFRRGVLHFRVLGKGGKIRYVPIHPHSIERITDYLALCGHGEEMEQPLFQPVRNRRTGFLIKPLSGNAIYMNVARFYAAKIGLRAGEANVHGMRATAATNALDQGCDIAKVQEWIGHANIATTRIYDRRKTKVEDSPTYKVRYE